MAYDVTIRIIDTDTGQMLEDGDVFLDRVDVDDFLRLCGGNFEAYDWNFIDYDEDYQY